MAGKSLSSNFLPELRNRTASSPGKKRKNLLPSNRSRRASSLDKPRSSIDSGLGSSIDSIPRSNSSATQLAEQNLTATKLKTELSTISEHQSSTSSLTTSDINQDSDTNQTESSQPEVNELTMESDTPSTSQALLRKIIGSWKCSKRKRNVKSDNNSEVSESEDGDDVSSSKEFQRESGKTELQQVTSTPEELVKNEQVTENDICQKCENPGLQPDQSLHLDDYAAAYLTEQGGRLTLPNSQVNLYVPKGAVPPGKTQLVELEIQRSGGIPDLEEGKTWSTSTVRCGPHGVKFQKDVFLIMPHCLTDIDQWDISPYQVKGEEWKKLEGEEEALVIKQKKMVIMMMDHFCRQKICACPSGDSKDIQTKEINVSVYLENEGTDRRVTVCLTNAYEKIPTAQCTPFGIRMTKNLAAAYFCPNNASLKFLSEPRFRKLCSVLDFLERNTKRGWALVAEGLHLDIQPDIVDTTNWQQHQSSSAVFLEAFFQKRLQEKDGVLDSLMMLSNACEKVDTHQPKRIIDEEIREIQRAKVDVKRELLSERVISVRRSGLDVCITYSDETKDGDIREATERIIAFDKLWTTNEGGPDSPDALMASFNVPHEDISAVLQIYQKGNKENDLLLDLKISEQETNNETPFKAERYEMHKIYARRTPTTADNCGGELLESVGVSELRVIEAFKKRAERHHQNARNVERDLIEAIDGSYMMVSNDNAEETPLNTTSANDEMGLVSVGCTRRKSKLGCFGWVKRKWDGLSLLNRKIDDGDAFHCVGQINMICQEEEEETHVSVLEENSTGTVCHAEAQTQGNVPDAGDIQRVFSKGSIASEDSGIGICRPGSKEHIGDRKAAVPTTTGEIHNVASTFSEYKPNYHTLDAPLINIHS